MKEIQLQLDLAFGCIASDGEVAKVELDCLKSICIQRGYSSADFHAAMDRTRQKFDQDITGLCDSLVSNLLTMRDDLEKQLDVLEILIELIVSDGAVEQGELSFIRFVIASGQWDASALRRAKPEWRKYIQDGFDTNLELRTKVLAKMTEGIQSEN